MLRYLAASSALALCLAASVSMAQTTGNTSSGGARSTPSGANSAGSATPTPGSTSPAATGQTSGGAAVGGTTSGTTSGSTSASGAAGSAGAATSAALTEPEMTFVKKAAASDLTEIETSRVAVQKATRPEVKQFAQQMIEDHTRLSNTMKQLASARGVQLPPRDPSVDAMVSKLNGLSGAKFDQEYVKGQVGGHRDASKLYHTEGAQVRDPQLKQAVATATPLIDQHLQHVEQLASSLGVEGKTSLKK